MDYFLYGLTIWAIVAIIFFALIRYEAQKQEADFNILQLLVAMFWFLWGPWYAWTLLKEWWAKK